MNKLDHPFDKTTEENVNRWLLEDYDQATKTALKEMIEKSPEKVVDAFYKDLSFGTGGLRGVMGIGTNRMNEYTVARATQGLANYIKQSDVAQAVAIGYDSRDNSAFFAQVAADVLAGNQIEVYLFKQLRPTPLVSFSCRYNQCGAAIMITASHNPPEYNGYKVYWEDGAQILPPHDSGIIQEVKKVQSLSQIQREVNSPLIHIIDNEVDLAYFETIEKMQTDVKKNKEHGNQLKIVYSNLHGTGSTLMQEALLRWGFKNFSSVEAQEMPDGSFPTVSSPNPEEKSALAMGIEEMEKEHRDILIATDPDADRVGVALMHQGECHLLTGHQIASVCLSHLLENRKLQPNSAFVKTIVTTELFQKIAEKHNFSCFNVLTGFKYVAEKIREWEEDNSYSFVFGGEESYGYLLGTHARDKDAIISSLVISEAALYAKLEGKTLIDKLHELYQTHGIYEEDLVSVKFPETKAGREKMEQSMENIRSNPPKTILSKRVVRTLDYLTKEEIDLQTSQKTIIELPVSNVLVFWLEDETKIVVRPSGTEPKVKLYGGIQSAIEGDIQIAIANAKKELKAALKEIEERLLG